MKTIIFTLLMVISGLAHASQTDDWLKKLEHPYSNGDLLKPQNLLQKYVTYDFSLLLIPRTDFLGYIGDNYRRLYIHLKSISRDPKYEDNYLVVGESIVGKNVNSFIGNIKVTSVREYAKLHYGCDDELKDAGIQSEGLLIGQYKFQEDQTQPHSGTFEGIVTMYWYKDKTGAIKYDDIDASFSDSYTNNQYVGTWTAYQTTTQKIANWGERRVPFSGDLDRGAAEFSPDPKYKNQGWDKN